MKKNILKLIIIFVLITIIGCKPIINKNSIPFLSNNLLSDNNLGQNEIFLNYWDIENGKLYINYEKLYTGFKQGTYSSIFPYFWDGNEHFYFNCQLKEIYKKSTKIYKTLQTDLPQFSIFLETPIVVKIQDNFKLKIYEMIDNKMQLKNEFEILFSKLPVDLLKDQEIIPFIIIEKTYSSYKIICIYNSLNSNIRKLLNKLFIIDLHDGKLDVNLTKGLDLYSVPWLFGDNISKMFFLKKDKLFFQFCCTNENLGLLWSLDLNSGEFKKVINFLKNSEIYPSYQESETKEGIYYDNYIGYYLNYYIFYNEDEIVATNENGEILGKIIIYKKDKKIEVYKNGKLTQKINIKNSFPSFKFPNYSNN
ncbi:MAG: hypothetical protein QMD25_07055 [Caldisericia bacterium]|jgi:hypothetical protein|nr:hypothetical protein [Caldisericia bacterium]